MLLHHVYCHNKFSFDMALYIEEYDLNYSMKIIITHLLVSENFQIQHLQVFFSFPCSILEYSIHINIIRIF
jgi:hypothetical protein